MSHAFALLLGAGFNADAAHEVGPVRRSSLYGREFEIDCRYPLVNDVAKVCLDLDAPPVTSSIEELFQSRLATGDFTPLERLSDQLMKADYYLALDLALRSDRSSCYTRFFDRFPTAPVLTFNYDSLPEIVLFRTNRWYPHDGYGIPVDVRVGYNVVGLSPDSRSSTSVLHLHGSLCIYTSETTSQSDTTGFRWLVAREEPRFIFDPDAIGAAFSPFMGLFPVLGHEAPGRRVVAPVPRKATQLQQPFIHRVYELATDVLRHTDLLVAIGYSFGEHDSESYHCLLQTLTCNPQHRLVVVSPEADTVCDRLQRAYPTLRTEPRQLTFRQWVDADFPGLLAFRRGT